jgi:stringent starvation protein B
LSTQKCAEYIRLLEMNYTVRTQVDCDLCDGLPNYLSGRINLDLGLNMPIPIRRLQVTEKGIFADLSFRGQVHDVFLPWEGVTGVYAESMGTTSLETEESADPVLETKGNVVSVDFKKRRRA